MTFNDLKLLLIIISFYDFKYREHLVTVTRYFMVFRVVSLLKLALLWLSK